MRILSKKFYKNFSGKILISIHLTAKYRLKTHEGQYQIKIDIHMYCPLVSPKLT